MFKSKEELTSDAKDLCETCGEEIVNLVFKSIVERKEFYKRYCYDINLFIREQSDIFEKYQEHNATPEIIHIDFSDWLFDFCFDGV